MMVKQAIPVLWAQARSSYCLDGRTARSSIGYTYGNHRKKIFQPSLLPGKGNHTMGRKPEVWMSKLDALVRHILEGTNLSVTER
jgi:hypothetical protein